VDGVLASIRLDIKQLPQPGNVRFEEETVYFDMDSKATGYIILNQAFSTYWTLSGRNAERFLGLWPSWKVHAAGPQTITYWPRGLTVGLFAAGIGLVILLLLNFLVLRRTAGLG
jgi:hypothetical protein